MPKIKIIFFDFFGVLSTPVYKKVIEAFLPETEHAAWIQKLDILDRGELSEDELARDIAGRAGVPQEKVRRAVEAAPTLNEELFSFVKEKIKPHFQVGLLTNIPKSLLVRLIPDRLSLFNPVLISSELRLIKPDPAIFNVAIQKAECEPGEILFIDDGVKNIEVARQCGLNGIVYYDFPSFLKEIEPYIGVS